MTAPFVKVSVEEQLKAALPVLLGARRLVVLDGYQPVDAIQTAGRCGIASWWARMLLARVVPSPNLLAWQLDPLIRASDKTRAFDRAIRIARHSVFGHRGGWVVSPARAA